MKAETIHTPQKYGLKRLYCSNVPIIIYIKINEQEIVTHIPYIRIYKYIAFFRDIGTSAG